MGMRDRLKRGAKRAIEKLGEGSSNRSTMPAPEPVLGTPGPSPDYEIPDHISAAVHEITEEDFVGEQEPVAEPANESTAFAEPEEEEEIFDGDPVPPEEAARIEVDVVDAIKTIFDPEIPVNIYELGLIYDVFVRPGAVVDVRMTLTSPNCPAAQSLPEEVKQKSSAVEGVSSSRVKVIWDPPWGPQMMSEAAQLELNLM